MNEQTDRADRERKLVKITSDEFADGMNQAVRRAAQESANRDWLLLALLLLSAIGFGISRYFFAG